MWSDTELALFLDGQTLEAFRHEFNCRINEAMQRHASVAAKVDLELCYTKFAKRR